MDKTLAAAFGIAGNRISGALLELYRSYNTMKEAGLKLTAADKAQFDKYVKQVSELAQFLNTTELMAGIDETEPREQGGDV